jgi:carbonic anhydrase
VHEQISASAGMEADWQPFHVIEDQLATLEDDVHRVRSHPLIANRAKVGGFLYDVDSGLLTRQV